MTDSWQRVQELFARCVDLDPASRGRLLESECTDPRLRRELEALLAAAETDAEPLETPLGRLAAQIIAQDTTGVALETGERIGPYRIVSELGRGGMGAVYVALRADGAYQQRVALKLLSGTLASPAAVERFLAERQILARLDHPNIARLLDGGTTETGAPFFVMELVEGEPIDAYCDREKLSIPHRLEVFLAVCDAVQHAHRQLVVHRDLKPSNVLVTREGAPKLLDFGIAKLLESGGGAGTLTRLGGAPLTPDYASPEQLLGEPITTASDVYALGLLLYELLTGRRAHRMPGGDLESARRVVCSDPVRRPSTVVAGTSAAQQSRTASSTETAPSALPEHLARLRATTPKRLRRQLRGDLDTILLAALRKEPERRYNAVSQLAEDLRRYLEGLPVRARGERLGYRVRKFARRHVPVLAASATAAALIVALLVFFTLRLSRERDRARQDAERARQVSSFLTELFEVSDPSHARGEQVTARSLLDRAASRIEDELSGQPEIQADLLETMGVAYRGLGLYPEAETLLQRALEEKEDVFGSDALETLATRNSLGTVYWRLGEYQRAEALHRDAYQLAVERYGEEHPTTLGIANNLGNDLWRLGRYEEAAGVQSATLERVRRVLGEDHADTARVRGNLAGVYWSQGRFERAAELYRAALESARRVLGEDHDVTLNALYNLALTLKAEGRTTEAEPLFEEAVERRRRVFGAEHPKTLATLSALASLYGETGRAEESLRLHRQIYEARRKLLGDDHPEVLASLCNVASAAALVGDTTTAERLFRRCLQRRTVVYGAEHPRTLHTASTMADFLHQAGREAEAEALYRLALLGLEHTQGRDHGETLEVMRNLAQVLLDLHRPHEAAELLDDASRRVRQSFGDEPLLKGTVLTVYGSALTQLARWDEAEAALLEAKTALEDADLSDREPLESARRALAELYSRSGRPEGGER